MLNIYRQYSVGSVRKQTGSILLEALIAFVILAGGLLVVFRFHTTTTATVADSKIRAEAMALAEAKLEQVRGFIGTEDYTVLMTAGGGLDEYAGTDYAADFTRSWTINQDPYPAIEGEPAEINVTVVWKDRSDVDQSVSLRSGIYGEDPSTGAALLAEAISLGGDPLGGDGFDPHDPTQAGTGYGGGKVTIKLRGSDGLYYEEGEVLPDLVVLDGFYSVEFTGTIESVNGALLLAVTLVSDDVTHENGECGVGGSPLSTTAVIYDPNGEGEWETGLITGGVPETGTGAWLDSTDTDPDTGELTGSPIEDPYVYTCRVLDIPIDDAWSGTITYVGEQGGPGPDEEVCIPNEGTTTLSFDKNSPEALQLGVVLVDKKNLCKLFL